MRTKDFFDVGQASQNLRASIIRIADKPVYVMDVVASEPRKINSPLLIQYSPLANINEDVETIPLKDIKVDMNPVKLGFCNYLHDEGYASYYVSRYPTRKWKIGLSRENISVMMPGGYEADKYVIGKLFPTKLLAATINNRYPSVKEIIKGFNRYSGTRAFSRRFTITSELRVYYKTTEQSVGIVKQDKGTISLFDDFFYLKEVLKEDLQ